MSMKSGSLYKAANKMINIVTKVEKVFDNMTFLIIPSPLCNITKISIIKDKEVRNIANFIIFYSL